MCNRINRVSLTFHILFNFMQGIGAPIQQEMVTSSLDAGKHCFALGCASVQPQSIMPSTPLHMIVLSLLLSLFLYLFEWSLTFTSGKLLGGAPNQSRKLVEWAGSCSHYLSNVMLPLTTLGLHAIKSTSKTKNKKQKRSFLFAHVIDPDDPGEIRWLRSVGTGRTMSGFQSDSQGIFSCSMTHSKKWRENDGNTKMAAPVRNGGFFRFSR